MAADPVRRCRDVVANNDLDFDILADEKTEAIRAFGVLHEKGHGGKDIALPAHFLIDRDGVVRWRHVADRVPDRPDPEQLIHIVRELTSSES